jgi:hypothetical protein
MEFTTSALMLCAALFFPVITSSQTVTYNYARGVNFDAFRSYKWITIEGASATDPLLDKDIRQAVEVELSGKHLTRSENASDLIIAYQISDRREKEIDMYRPDGTERYGPGWHYGDTYGYSHGYSFISSSSMSTTTDSVIPVGNLVLDMYDGAHHDLIWRGEVSKAHTTKRNPEDRFQDLRKAVNKLFETFP